MALTKEPLRLTRENHPENRIEAESQPTVTLGSMVGICALSGVLGMIFGTASLSSMRLDDSPWGMTGILPLVALAVSILSGWLGAFFWMCRKES